MLKVKARVRDRIEGWIYVSNRRNPIEHGGFLFASPRTDVIVDFLFLPNVADDPEREYMWPPHAEEIAKLYAKSKNLWLRAFFHSHPRPSFPSFEDLEFSPRFNLLEVLITPIRRGPSQRRRCRRLMVNGWFYDVPYMLWLAYYDGEPEEVDFVR